MASLPLMDATIAPSPPHLTVSAYSRVRVLTVSSARMYSSSISRFCGHVFEVLGDAKHSPLPFHSREERKWLPGVGDTISIADVIRFLLCAPQSWTRAGPMRSPQKPPQCCDGERFGEL